MTADSAQAPAGAGTHPLGQIVETFGGVERILRLTLAETMALEQRLGKSSIRLVINESEPISVREAVFVIHHAMRGGGSEIAVEASVAMLADEPFARLVTVALSVLSAAYIKEKAQNPPVPTAPTAKTTPTA